MLTKLLNKFAISQDGVSDKYLVDRLSMISKHAPGSDVSMQCGHFHKFDKSITTAAL